MVRRIAVLLCCLLSVVVFLRAEEVGNEKKIVAVPDFLLSPADKFEDTDVSILAGSMVSKILEERFKILPRTDLLSFLEKKQLSQNKLFSDREAVKTLAELNVSGVLLGRITKKGNKTHIDMILTFLGDGKVITADKSSIEKTGDFVNSCKSMAKQILEKYALTIVKPKEDITPTPEVPNKGVSDQEMQQMREALITVETNKGSFSMRLFPDEAPLTCRNFMTLMKNGHYQNSMIHRIIPGRIVQMGDFPGDLQKAADIPNEFNDRPHVEGTVAMARNPYTEDYSNGSQFYISLTRLEKLDRNYTVFGHIVKGMDVVKSIGATPVGGETKAERFKPKEELKILSARVEPTKEAFTPPAMLPPMITIHDKGTIVAEIQTTMGDFKMRFYTRDAPKSVANFIYLAQKHFYDGLIWHRVISEFMIQTGDPAPNDPMINEYSRKPLIEKPADLKHVAGTVAMAKNPNADESIHSSSQFYICVRDCPHLDGNYAIFGQVYEGLEIVKKISEVATDADDRPLSTVLVKKISIVNLGENNTPWDEGIASQLVPATANTPYSKTIALLRTDMGDIYMQFYTKEAPRTVANFIGLARKGFYDGMYIHRIIRNSVIQMGDPVTNGQQSPPSLDDEDAPLSHYEGTVAMAKTSEPNSATGQFFINVVDNRQYDKKYTIFAKVIQGLDVAQKIAQIKVTNTQGTPEKQVYISVKLMTYKD